MQIRLMLYRRKKAELKSLLILVDILGAFHSDKKSGNFGGNKNGFSDT